MALQLGLMGLPTSNQVAIFSEAPPLAGVECPVPTRRGGAPCSRCPGRCAPACARAAARPPGQRLRAALRRDVDRLNKESAETRAAALQAVAGVKEQRSPASCVGRDGRLWC